MSSEKIDVHPEIRGDSQDFFDILHNQILKNKIIVISAIVVAVLCYGFTITNFSIGVDDPASWHYLHTDGRASMIQQGRLSHVLLEAMTGDLTFIPFFNDCLGVILFVFSAWVLCGVFQYVTRSAFSSWSLAAFCGIYLSYSLINEKFIYNLDVIVTMLSYLSFGFALLYAYQFVYERNRWAAVKGTLWLILSISSYESFIFLYITGVFFLFLLKIFINGEKVTFRELIVKGLQFAALLLVACLVYYSAVVVVQLLTHQYGRFHRGSQWHGEEGFWAILMRELGSLKRAMSEFGYFPILVFDVAAALGICYFGVKSIHRKSVVGFLCFLGFVVSNLLIHILSCEILFRASQGYCLVVAGVALCLLHEVEGWKKKGAKWGRQIAYFLAAWLIFMQAADLNQWFYNDYARYKKDEFVIHSVATRLVAECDLSKPVVFTNPNHSSYLYSYGVANDTNGTSIVMQAVSAFGEIQSQTMIALFRLHGYDFIQMPTYEQAQQGLELSKDMDPWPEPGCIQEFDDVIVVNFGESEK